MRKAKIAGIGFCVLVGALTAWVYRAFEQEFGDKRENEKFHGGY